MNNVKIENVKYIKTGGKGDLFLADDGEYRSMVQTLSDYIYKDGDTCDVFTGGYDFEWVRVPPNNGFADVDYNYNKSLMVYVSDTLGTLTTISNIDITSCEKLYVDLTCARSSSNYDGTITINIGSTVVYTIKVPGRTVINEIISIDVSSITGSHQISFNATEPRGTLYLYIYKAWFEKNEAAEIFTKSEKNKLSNISAGATKVTGSPTNGNILIDNVETKVYTHPTGVNPHGVTKTDVGLGNVDNTTDLNKPISTAAQAALDGKIDTSQKGVTNGIAQLNSNGVVPSSQLPSYVDDVLEYTSNSLFPAIGESGKIYINTTTNITYRWTGSGYAEISPSIALGETSSTAYAGDKGKTTTDKVNGHTGNTNNPHGVTKTQVGLGNVPNVTTNNQTPTYTVASTNTTLTSGEILSTAFGKIAKAISSLITHLADTVSHITSTERTNWNSASANKHTHTNKTVLDNTTASYTTAEKTKLSGIANNANNYTLPVASTVIGGVKSGTDITVDTSGNVSVNDDSHNHIIDNVDGLRTELDWVNNNTPNTSNGGSSKTSIVFPHANGVGVNFWNSQNYSIYMSKADDATYGGRVGETVSDYNMYFTMNGDTRGFVFKRGQLSLAAIDANGNIRPRSNVVLENNLGIYGKRVDGTSDILIRRTHEDVVVVGSVNHSTFIHSYSTPTITLPSGSYRMYHEGNKPLITDLGGVTPNGTVAYAKELSTVSTSTSVPPRTKRWTRLATLRLTVQHQETNIQFNIMNNDASMDIITAIVSARVKQQTAMGTNPYTGVVVNGVGFNANNFKAIMTTSAAASTLDLYVAMDEDWRTFSMSKTLSANNLSALTPLQPFIDLPSDAKFVPVIFK